MSEWKEYKLGEVADVQTGPFGSQLHQSDYVAYGIPSIMPVNIGNRLNITTDKIVYVSEEDANRLKKYRVKEGDIVYSRRGDVEKCAYIRTKENGWLCGTGCLRIRIDMTIAYPRFVAYFLSTEEVKSWISNNAVGTTMPNLNSGILQCVDMILPPIEEQKRIAEVLSSLDDKIDLLNRENATLEALAETLFRHYFIENPNSTWKEGKLGDSVDIKRGGSPRPITDYLAPSGYRWLKISDVTNIDSPYIFHTKEYIKESGLKKTVLLNEGSLVLSNSATPGIPKILCVDSCIHDGWLYFPKSKFSKYYLYLFFKYIRQDLINLGNGSIFTNLKTDILKNYVINIPDSNSLDKFEGIVRPLFEKMLDNSKQIIILETQRDTLLPTLMTGEVKLKDNKL